MSEVLFEQEGEVAEITINREASLNALNENVIELMLEAIHHTMTDEARVLVIKGAGKKAFVAGADIKPMQGMSSEQAFEFARKGQLLLNTLEKIPQITIAKIRGFALGGGCELVMGCDLSVASEDAKFGQPEVNLGLIPGFGGTQRLARRVGLPKALDMLLCGHGRTLSAKEAESSGLISRVVPEAELDDAVNAVIKAVLNTGPTASSETKRLCRESLEMPLEAGLNSEAAAFALRMESGEANEGISAFLEKRRPSF